MKSVVSECVVSLHLHYCVILFAPVIICIIMTIAYDNDNNRNKGAN